MYEAWQLWLERDVVKRIVLVFQFVASFLNHTSSKSHHRPSVERHLPIFAPQNVWDTDRAASDLRYKITPHCEILAKVPQGGVLRPGGFLEREKIIGPR